MGKDEMETYRMMVAHDVTCHIIYTFQNAVIEYSCFCRKFVLDRVKI